MNRRDFIAFASATAAFQRLAFAQQAKVPHILVLSRQLSDALRQDLRQGLGDYGYVDGKNIAVDFLEATTNDADMPSYAAQALSRHPDLIWTLSAPAPVALKGMGTSIPVVFTNLIDPVELGLVENLAHPGGNMTGNTILGAPLAGKALELLRELVPTVSRLALFETSATVEAAALRGQLYPAAAALGIGVVSIDVKNVGEDFAPYADHMKASGAQAIFMAGYLATGVQSGPTLYDLCYRSRWPTVATTAGNLESGGLFSYGASNDAITRRSAYYVDQILKGANPGTLAVELPMVFDLVINLRTAHGLNITVPPDVLSRADRVIE